MTPTEVKTVYYFEKDGRTMTICKSSIDGWTFDGDLVGSFVCGNDTFEIR